MRLQRFAPQPHSGKSDACLRHAFRDAGDEADIVGEELVTPVGEPCGHRRLAGARMTQESNRSTIDHQRIGMERQ